MRADIIVWRFVMAPGTRVCPTTPTVCTPRSSWSPFPPSSSGPRCRPFVCVCVSCVMLMLGWLACTFTLGWPWRSSGRGRMSLASQHCRFPRQVRGPASHPKGRFAHPSISNLFHVLCFTTSSQDMTLKREHTSRLALLATQRSTTRSTISLLFPYYFLSIRWNGRNFMPTSGELGRPANCQRSGLADQVPTSRGATRLLACAHYHRCSALTLIVIFHSSNNTLSSHTFFFFFHLLTVIVCVLQGLWSSRT